MNARILLASIAACASFATPSAHAAINGYFDYINVSMVDTAVGWICDSASPNSAPSGTLVVYRNGSYHGEWNMYSAGWGTTTNMSAYRPDVNSAGYCGSNAYTSFNINSWFAPSTSPGGIEIYYKFPDGSTQLLGGSGKVCSTSVGTCY